MDREELGECCEQDIHTAKQIDFTSIASFVLFHL